MWARPGAAAELCTPGAGRFAERSCEAGPAEAVLRRLEALDAAELEEPAALQRQSPRARRAQTAESLELQAALPGAAEPQRARMEQRVSQWAAAR